MSNQHSYWKIDLWSKECRPREPRKSIFQQISTSWTVTPRVRSEIYQWWRVGATHSFGFTSASWVFLATACDEFLACKGRVVESWYWIPPFRCNLLRTNDHVPLQRSTQPHKFRTVNESSRVEFCWIRVEFCRIESSIYFFKLSRV